MVDKKEKQNKETLQVRPPIVVILGHIDHGKTSLLLAIRDFEFTSEKPGGEITQHIATYQVKKDGKEITFLDTPGHEAFSQMRSRGANVADIAILVVDATQGVQAQTKEVIADIKETNIQVIVVLNKIDRPEANPERVKKELEREGIVVESLGGKVPALEVSARTKKGIPDLLELILLMAEMAELKADYNKPAKGVVVESFLDNLRGPTATLLLTDGHLKVGDIIATSSALTKVKSIENFKKETIEKALPSDSVIIFGFDRAAQVGERFQVFNCMEDAQDCINCAKESKDLMVDDGNLVLEDGQKVVNLILKADVLGSIEAIECILSSLPQDKVILKILKSEIGNINESDIKLAQSSESVILAFRVKVDSIAKKLQEREKTRILNFDIIYDLVEEVTKLMERVLEPEEIITELGKLKVLGKFLTEKNRQIVGGKVIEGEIKKGSLIQVLRHNPTLNAEEKVGQGRLINLQRDKKEIEAISKGNECGVLFEGNVSIQEGDVLLFFTREKRKGQL